MPLLDQNPGYATVHIGKTYDLDFGSPVRFRTSGSKSPPCISLQCSGLRRIPWQIHVFEVLTERRAPCVTWSASSSSAVGRNPVHWIFDISESGRVLPISSSGTGSTGSALLLSNRACYAEKHPGCDCIVQTRTNRAPRPSWRILTWRCWPMAKYPRCWAGVHRHPTHVLSSTSTRHDLL